MASIFGKTQSQTIRKKIWFILFILIITVFCVFAYRALINNTSLFSNHSKPATKSTSTNLKVAFFGDTGITETSIQVVKLVKREGAELAIVPGDLDYINSPNAWEKMINDNLGNNFPVFIAVGNHEIPNMKRYEEMIENRTNKIEGAKCSGRIPFKYNCEYKGLEMIIMSPEIADTSHEYYVENTLDDSDSIWRICIWHYNESKMQTAKKTAMPIGYGIYDTCRKGGAIIVNGHTHNYSRSFLSSDFSQQIVADSSKNTANISRGNSIVLISGLGGRPMVGNEYPTDFWAKVYSKKENAKYGALFCTFNIEGDERKANCYFKNIQDEIVDQFEIVNNVQ